MPGFADIAAFIALIVSLSGAVLAWRKFSSLEVPQGQVTNQNVLTDTSLKLVTAIRAEMENDRKEMEADRKSFQAEMESMRASLTSIRNENTELRAKLTELEDVRDWAERLTHQVISLGGTPVPLIPPKKAKQ